MFELQTAFVAALCLAFTGAVAGEGEAAPPAETVEVERVDGQAEDEAEAWAAQAAEAAPAVEKVIAPDELPPEGVIELERVVLRRTLSGEGLWHFDTLIGTDFPIEIGGRFMLETPSRLRLMLGLGGLPKAYQSLANDVIVAAGGYDAEIASIVDETIRAAFVLQTGVGLRPAKAKGFVFDVGYRMVMFTAQNTPSSVLGRVSNVTVPAELSEFAGNELRLRSHVHQVTVRAGWEWLAAERLSIRFDLGGSFSLDTTHKLLSYEGSEVPRAAQGYIEQAGVELDRMVRRYGHTPTVGLSFGYRWF